MLAVVAYYAWSREDVWVARIELRGVGGRTGIRVVVGVVGGGSGGLSTSVGRMGKYVTQ